MIKRDKNEFKGFKSPEEETADEMLLLKRIAVEVSELTLGNPLSLRLTKAYADYAKYKEQRCGEKWHRTFRKKYRS